MIEVKNLVKKYGSLAAVNDLSFTVEKGQVVGFLGPNGAGKSTTMNIITGYIPADEGSVCVNGHDMGEEPMEAKKSIGYLPEVPPLYPDMRVGEYLRFVAELKGVAKKERDRMLKEIMEMTCIDDRKKQLIKHLSKGYRQRVGLAGALMGYPEVIILDEPTVGLDPGQIIEIRDLIKKLSKEHTVILSSHILSEVSAVCDQVMIINNGKLIVSDTTEHLTEHMQSKQILSVTVKGTEEVVCSALEKVEAIESFEARASGEENVTATIQSRPNTDAREEVSLALGDAHCAVLEMITESKSLEDVFLELTKEDTEDRLHQEEIKEQAEPGDRVDGTKAEEETGQIEGTAIQEEPGQKAEPGVQEETGQRKEEAGIQEETGQKEGTAIQEEPEIKRQARQKKEAVKEAHEASHNTGKGEEK